MKILKFFVGYYKTNNQWNLQKASEFHNFAIKKFELNWFAKMLLRKKIDDRQQEIIDYLIDELNKINPKFKSEISSIMAINSNLAEMVIDYI